MAKLFLFLLLSSIPSIIVRANSDSEKDSDDYVESDNELDVSHHLTEDSFLYDITPIHCPNECKNFFKPANDLVLEWTTSNCNKRKNKMSYKCSVLVNQTIHFHKLISTQLLFNILKNIHFHFFQHNFLLIISLLITTHKKGTCDQLQRRDYLACEACVTRKDPPALYGISMKQHFQTVRRECAILEREKVLAIAVDEVKSTTFPACPVMTDAAILLAQTYHHIQEELGGRLLQVRPRHHVCVGMSFMEHYINK